MAKMLCCLIFLLVGFFVRAQKEACGFDDLLRQQMADPATAARISQINKKIETTAATLKAGRRVEGIAPENGIYEIPLVFHIMHRGEPIGTVNNPSDATIESMVNFLNSVYAGANAPTGTPTPIRFVLAKRWIGCIPTNGINRVDASSYTSYVNSGVYYGSGQQGMQEISLKNLSRWSPKDYYNIWIVWKATGSTGLNLNGYAYYPGASEVLDGTVIVGRVANSTEFTLAHELGHALGLYHTFEKSSGSNCAQNANCETGGDGICDTDPHLETFGCPLASDINPCTTMPWGTLPQNIMGYFSCRFRFTTQQGARALATLLSSKASLLSSRGGIPLPAGGLTPKPIAYSTTVTNTTQSSIAPAAVSLSDILLPVSEYNTSVKIPYEDNTCLGTTKIDVGSGTDLKITTTGARQSVKAWLDINNNGVYETEELLGSGITPSGTTASYVHTIAIPVSTLAKATLNVPLRLRVASDVSNNTTYTYNSQLQNGQMKDFTVVIENAKPSSVVFGDMAVLQVNDSLKVNWTSLSEYKNRKFMVRVSKDSLAGYKTIGELTTLSVNGYSVAAISYQFGTPFSNIVQISAAFALGLILLCSFRKKTPLYRPVLFFAILITLFTLEACRKEKDKPGEKKETPQPKEEKYFVRIAYEDIDGTIQYSKPVSFIKKP